MTHDTLMHLADNFASLHRHSTDDESAMVSSRVAERDEAKAALSTALQELAAERDEHKENAFRNARSALTFRAERNALVNACGQYEAALNAAFPAGAHGHAFEHWNDARKLLNERDAMKGTP